MNTTSIFNELVQIQSWPSVGLVFALVIIVGYCFRFWKSFPNEAIPAIVILTGAIGMMLLAEATPKDIAPRIWHTRNFIIGLTVGFVAWMAHALVVSKIEDFLATKFQVVDRLLNKPLPPPTP